MDCFLSTENPDLGDILTSQMLGLYDYRCCCQWIYFVALFRDYLQFCGFIF